MEGFRHCSVKEATRLKEQAEKLLVTAILDSSHFVMDYLLGLEPIRALHGSSLYNVCYDIPCVVQEYIGLFNCSCWR